MKAETRNPLVEKFEGDTVRVFLNNGKTLMGVAEFNGHMLHVKDQEKNNEAIVNLDYVVAISKL